MTGKATVGKKGKMIPRAAANRAEAAGKAVRLDLLPEDFDRLEAVANKRGLSKSAYVRMMVLESIWTESPTREDVATKTRAG